MVKLVVAASIIVALVTGVVTAVAEHELDAITEDQIALRRQAGEEAIQRTSQLLVSAVATAIKLPLSTSAYSEIKPILDAALADDRAQRDSRLLWLAVMTLMAIVPLCMAQSLYYFLPRSDRPAPRGERRAADHPVKIGHFRVSTYRT